MTAGLLFGSGALAAADSDTPISTGPTQTAEVTGVDGGVVGSIEEDQPTTVDPKKSEDDEATELDKVTQDDADADTAATLGSEDKSTGVDEDKGTGVEAGAPADEKLIQPDSGTETANAPTTEPAQTSTPSTKTTAGSGSSNTKPAAKPDQWAQMWKALQPVTDAVNTFSGIVESVPQTLVDLQTSEKPIRDAIASMQSMIFSMADAVIPLAQVPGDLYGLLGVQASSEAPPLIGRSGSSSSVANTRVRADAPLFGPQTSPAQAPAARPIPTVPASAPLFGTMAPEQPVGTATTTELSRELSVSGTVPLATGTSEAEPSLFQHVVEAVLVPASLTALAALALPGLGALLVVCAAGIRVGYRQAKAALALRASGIARFAGPGPLGVARSGSRVILRQRARGPRSKLTGCPEARSARMLKPVA